MLLLFGKESFVGKNLNADVKISRSDCDIENFEQVFEVIKRFKPNSIINCGAAHASARSMSKAHTSYLTRNVTMDSNILKASHALNVENVILLSSISAFPNISSGDLTENDLYKGEINPFNFGYNTSKRITYELSKTYQIDFHRNYKVLFLGNLYGKFARFTLDANVLNSIVFQMFKAKIEKSDLTLYGTGADQRAFTYVEDLNNIIDPFINDVDFESSIFSSNEVLDIKSLASKIADYMGYNGNVLFSGEDSGAQGRKVASSNYLLSKLSDFEFTSIDLGLKKVIDWYISSNVNPSK
jgi:GDP-L-fucose synthase